MRPPAFWKNGTDLVEKVYKLARPYGRKRLAAVMGISLLQGLFQMLGVTSIFPFLALAADPGRLRSSNYGRKFLDFLPPMDDGRLLLVAGAFAIVMLVLSNGVNLAAEFVRNRYAYGFAHWLRVGLLRKIAMRPYGVFLNENSAVTIKKVGMDVVVFTGSVFLPLLDIFARVVTVVFLLAALFLVQPEIAAGAAVLFFLFYSAVFRLLGQWRRRASQGLDQAQTGMFTHLQHLLGGIKAAKVHRAEEFLAGQFSRHSARQSRLMSYALLVANTPRYLIEPIAFGALVAVVLVYAARGMDFISLLPNLGVMALAGYRLMPMFQLVYGQLSQLSTWRHTMDEVYDELNAVERMLVERSSAGGDLLD
ncbi:ABC transporter ATP-binding protein, partial [bacterium]|nr:ABC transporter ATP-binding protein [bacterium]